MKGDRVVAGLDVGTSGVVCIVAEIREDGATVITGAARVPSPGLLRDGMVVDVEGVAAAAEKAAAEVEVLSTWPVDDVFVSVTGNHVMGFAGKGSVSIGKGDDYQSREITRADVEKAEEAAMAVGLPAGCRILEVVRRDYSVDNFESIRKPPVGLRAEQLSSRIYTVIADRVAVANLVTAVEASGRAVRAVVPAAMASAAAVLTEDEKEMGVAVADIGAGTTDVAVFLNGTLAFIGVVPVGGDLITSDIQTLRVPALQAEKLKTGWAVACNSMADANKTVKVASLGGRGTFAVSHAVVSQIVTQRVQEVFEGVAGELARSGVSRSELPAGLVITGGSSRFPGICETGREVLGLPVEKGVPVELETSTELVRQPEYATAVGLLICGGRHPEGDGSKPGGKLFEGIGRKLRGFLGRLR
jgi:cell division protein FtsA